jgi:hypothetical protein
MEKLHALKNLVPLKMTYHDQADGKAKYLEVQVKNMKYQSKDLKDQVLDLKDQVSNLGEQD